MRIATWNVNGLRARLEFVRLWLQARQPDVVALQELKLDEALFPRDTFASLGYRAVVCCQKAWNGVAVLSREPAHVLQAGLPGREEEGARLLAVHVAGLRVVAAYVPNGKSVEHPDFPRKLGWLDALAEHVEAHPGGPTVLCGDFNLCPGPLDTWNEELLSGQIFHTDLERARFRRLLEAGYRDLFRERNPEARLFSWWDYRAGAFHRGHGLRIDFLLGTPDVLERVRSVEIDRDWRKKKEGWTPSDHAPVVADLS